MLNCAGGNETSESRHLSPSAVTAPTWLPAPASNNLGGNQDSVKYQRLSLCSQIAVGLNTAVLYFGERRSSCGPSGYAWHCVPVVPGRVAGTLTPICLPAHGAVKVTF